MRNAAKNDYLIEQLVADPLYRFRPDGFIETLVCQTGKVSTKGVWRVAGRVNKRNERRGRVTDYKDISFKGSRLSYHRIIYRVFKGPLDTMKFVNHMDGNPLNNHPDNLELITPAENTAHGRTLEGRYQNTKAA